MYINIYCGTGLVSPSLDFKDSADLEDKIHPSTRPTYVEC